MGFSAHSAIVSISQQVESIVGGKEDRIKFALACLLSGGHLLIEDVPGVGKTTLSHALAISLGLEFSRVQFTSDMLPSDVLGGSIYNSKAGAFEFQPGPIFTEVLLADEINRASPKTQSAMLEAMEERQVSIDGASRPLPEMFFVIATQNPQNQIGTHALPESQLDRFMMRISIGYPSVDAEIAMLMGVSGRDLLQDMMPVVSRAQLLDLVAEIKRVVVSIDLARYVQRISSYTRECGLFVDGLSPRASISLIQAGRAWAAMENREYVIPEDIKAVALPVMLHRLRLGKGLQESPEKLVRDLLQKIPVSV